MSTKDQQTSQLLDMGFGNNRVVRALQATGFKVAERERGSLMNIFVRGWSRPWSGS